MSERIGLLLEPSSLQAQAGREATAVITVENKSTIVDQYALSLEGVEPGWYDLSSNVTGLFPGEKAQVQLTLRPPQTTQVQAGIFPFSIKASSLANPEERSVVEGSLELLPFGVSSLEMAPERIEGRSGITQLFIRNQSNAPAPLSLMASDLEEGLNYRFSADAITVPAGGESAVNIRVRPKRRPLFGSPHEYPFRVVALAPEERPEEAALAVEGTFTYKPPLSALARALRAVWPKLRPVLPLLLSLAALALALFAFLKPPPKTDTSPPSTPPPGIQYFRSEIGAGGVIQVKWQVSGAQQVSIDGKQVDPQQGTLTIDQPESKEYVLVASNAGGTANQTLGIVLLKPPTVVTFEASPASITAGATTTLSWKVENATKLSVDGEQVAKQDIAAGKREVKPDQTRDYVLIAENDVAWVVRRVTVQVQQEN